MFTGLPKEAFEGSAAFENTIKKDPITFDSIRKSIDDSFYKGLIDQELHDKAIQQLDAVIEKAGEGSRGGKVIGHTKSGKPIYATKYAHSYNDFTAEDHRDAQSAHADEMLKYDKKGYVSKYVGQDKRQDHLEHAISHYQHYQRLSKKENPIEKAGEGSKGGHVIGHTRSGKPIYASKETHHFEPYEGTSQQIHPNHKLHIVSEGHPKVRVNGSFGIVTDWEPNDNTKHMLSEERINHPDAKKYGWDRVDHIRNAVAEKKDATYFNRWSVDQKHLNELKKKKI